MNEVGKIRESPYKEKKDKSRKFIVLTIVSFFSGTFLIMLLFPLTFLDHFDLSKFILGFAVAGFLIPLKFYSKWMDFIKYEVIIFNLIGVAPFFTALFLSLNFLISTNVVTDKYEFNSFVKHGSSIELLVIDNNPELPNKAFICDPAILYQMRGNTLKITTAKGLFGLGVVKDREIVAN